MEKEKSSPPPILRRRKTMYLHRTNISNDSGNHSDYLIIGQHSQTENITPSTPIKQLPFSPSQFFNNLSPETSWVHASTPKASSPGPLTTPQPTGFRRNQHGTCEDFNERLSPVYYRKFSLKEFALRSNYCLQTVIRQERQRPLKTLLLSLSGGVAPLNYPQRLVVWTR